MTLPALAAPNLADLTGIRHGFFTRRGGVSTGIHAALNCGPGSDDDPKAVAENRRRVAAALGAAPEALATVHQVHGTGVATVAGPLSEPRPRADALVSNTPGMVLGILTADCVPVLFADKDARVIGACHAGWKGALAGVAEATLAAMVRLGASPGATVAAIGPAIRQPSYEVGPDFPAPFLMQDAANGAFFAPSPRAGHHLFDLPGYLRRRLERLGLAGIADLGLDTRSDPDRFFSYRRATLDREPDYGRQISAIMLAE